MVRRSDPPPRRAQAQPARVRSPAEALALFGPLFLAATAERVAAAYLVGDAVLAFGAVTAGDSVTTMLPMSTILREAILRGADSVLLAHNHPAGDPTPSPEDLRVTRRFADAASALDIRLLDHIVVARDGWLSLRMMGLL
jgi:DNA repair protein RadC